MKGRGRGGRLLMSASSCDGELQNRPYEVAQTAPETVSIYLVSTQYTWFWQKLICLIGQNKLLGLQLQSTI